jgi:hypothetical protein
MGEEKPFVVFLLSGESRTFPFSYDFSKRSDAILKSYTDNIFTDEFKKRYEYRIYITTTNVHLADTKKYFSENNIGNIHLFGENEEFNWYMKDIDSKLNNVNSYLEAYRSKDWTKFTKYENSIHQHYKIMDCYNLFANDYTAKKCKFIVRMRMDVEVTENIMGILFLLEENPRSQIIMHWDFFAAGRPEIMSCYCNGLKGNYGNYNFKTNVPESPPLMPDYLNVEKIRWTYAPERQLFEMLYEFCNDNNLKLHEAIKSCQCCSLIR